MRQRTSAHLTKFLAERIGRDAATLQQLEDAALVIAVQPLLRICKAYLLKRFYGAFVVQIEEHATKIKCYILYHTP